MTADKLENTQKYKLFTRKIKNKIVNGNKIFFYIMLQVLKVGAMLMNTNHCPKTINAKLTSKNIVKEYLRRWFAFLEVG